MTEEEPADLYSSRQSVRSSKSVKLLRPRSRAKKAMVSNSVNSCQDECSCEETQALKENNKRLQEKISLLQIQLQTQCRLHAVAHRRSSPHSCQKRCPTPNTAHTTGGTPQSSSRLDATEDKKRQLILMTEEMQAIHRKYETRIKELETELSSKTTLLDSNEFTKVSDNVEIIKLRRLCKKQTAQICTLQSHLELVEKKLTLYVREYQASSGENEQLKERNEELSGKVSQLELNHANKQAFEIHVKALEERIADLERERNELKKTVGQLNQIINQQGEHLVYNDLYRKRIEELEVLNNELAKELNQEKSQNKQ
uniref:Uncharacterized protein n=1 Tax=Cacopsylla melanoneura TaxID=428564 RepID=A0A8D8TA61_9HEMI